MLASRRLPRRALALAAALALTGTVTASSPAFADEEISPVAPWAEGYWMPCDQLEAAAAEADPEAIVEPAQFCVETATVTPVDGEATPVAELGLSTHVNGLGATSFNWSIDGLDYADEAVVNGEIRLVVRLGTFVPRYTMGTAKNLHISRTTDDNGNLTMDITGRATHIDWNFEEDIYGPCISGVSCGTEDTMAQVTGSGFRFTGNTQDLSVWGEDAMTTLDGVYIATNAESRPTMIGFGTYPEPYWSLNPLGNVHLDAQGNPVRGSFNAWLPPSYFASLGTDAETAAATGFNVMSQEGDETVSLPVEVGLDEGGVAMNVADMGFSVHAITVTGEPSEAVPGAAAPESPAAVTAIAANAGLAAHWTAPDTAIPAVSRYTARAFTAPTGGTIAGRCTAAASASTCTITGLTNDTEYYVSVSATNAMGEGSGTAERVVGVPAVPVAPAPVAPTAPRAVTATAGNALVTAAWTAPLSNGGAAITGYTARAYSAATGGTQLSSCASTALARTCVLRNLTNGANAYVAVTATNSAGVGVPNATRVRAVARTVPSAPRSVTAKSTGSRITVKWATPASNGGAAVGGYAVKFYASATGTNVATAACQSGSQYACTTGKLVVGRTYYVAVQAGNVAGLGKAATRVKVVVKK